MQLGRLSLVPFFDEAKKGTCRRATPGQEQFGLVMKVGAMRCAYRTLPSFEIPKGVKQWERYKNRYWCSKSNPSYNSENTANEEYAD
jgi:hypothetical protein